MNLPVYLVITGYFPTPTNWRCAFVYDQVCAIQRTGRYRVFVVNINSERDYDYNGISVMGLKCVHRGSFLFPSLLATINNSRFDAALRRNGLDVGCVSVVHAHQVTTAYFAMHVKKQNKAAKMIVQLHDMDPYFVATCYARNELCGLKLYLQYRWHRKLLETADIVVAVSENVAKCASQFPRQAVGLSYKSMRRVASLLRFCRSPNLKKILILHNGIDKRIFQRTNTHCEQGRQFVIGSVGNFIRTKDQLTLLKALQIIRAEDILVEVDTKIKFVGSGPCLEKCMDYAEKYGLMDNVEFISEVDHHQLVDFYNSLDLFVLPSYFEGFGCVYLEAWGCGVPFIACKGAGIEDMVCQDERNIWLCEERNPEDLAKKIKFFVERRPTQHMADEVDIDKLIPHFLDDIEKIQ